MLQVLFELLACLCDMCHNPSMASFCQEYKVQTPYISSQEPPKYSLAYTLQGSLAGFLQAYLHICASVSFLTVLSATVMAPMPHHHQVPATCHVLGQVKATERTRS